MNSRPHKELAEILSKDMLTILIEWIRKMVEFEPAFFRGETPHVPVMLYWKIGHAVVQPESSNNRVRNESAISGAVSSVLYPEFGSHFSRRNMMRMVSVARAYPKSNEIIKYTDKLKWCQFVELSKISTASIRNNYARESFKRGWTVRMLREKIQSKALHHRDERSGEQAAVRPKPAMAASTSPVDLQVGREAVYYPVWFSTNREPSGDGKHFSNARGSLTTHGRVWVKIPNAHRFGETGSSILKRICRLDFRDDRLRIESIEILERNAFIVGINDIVSKLHDADEEAHALVFIHGYNVSFREAAIRAAQIGYDLKVPGPTAFFSWPSRGTFQGYPADEATIEVSEQAITDFLVDFRANCGAERVHVIAHSMGNRGLLRALQRISANAETKGKVKFGQIFLAAPDVDRDLFIELARLYPEHSERTTLYASKTDLAVWASQWLHGAARAGYYTPYTVAPGVDTVAVPNFNIDILGHAYFARAEALLNDIYNLMHHNDAPSRRQRIIPVSREGMSFWQLLR